MSNKLFVFPIIWDTGFGRGGGTAALLITTLERQHAHMRLRLDKLQQKARILHPKCVCVWRWWDTTVLLIHVWSWSIPTDGRGRYLDCSTHGALFQHFKGIISSCNRQTNRRKRGLGLGWSTQEAAEGRTAHNGWKSKWNGIKHLETMCLIYLILFHSSLYHKPVLPT